MKQKKVYRTALGKEIDIQQLSLLNERAVALGNANLNARGDQVDAHGKIIKKREELAQEYYRSNPKAVRNDTAIVEDIFVTKPLDTPLKSETDGFDQDGYDSKPL